MTKEEILFKYFGYQEFKSGQEEAISAIISGESVLGIMPTGAGKSVCYQVPAIMADGITIVISPLISLMQDQVAALNQMGVRTAYINSNLSQIQIEKALFNARGGMYKIIYVAPERLETNLFLNFAKNANISIVAVDEAHCISGWGQDFRPSYTQIPNFLLQLAKKPTLCAFTATATARVEADIARLLFGETPKIISTGFDRENLFFEVRHPENKKKELLEIIEKNKKKNGIIYCTSRKRVDELCETLQNAKYSVSKYHAGLEKQERFQNQEDFLFDRTKIMVATTAFGMGINKSNVAYVIHYNMPKDIETYYQEAGRAGRDGTKAVCTLFYNAKDVETIKWMIENKDEEISVLCEGDSEEVKKLEYVRLAQMKEYCQTGGCLRKFILGYFGENAKDECGGCSNCDTSTPLVDITEESSQILSLVSRVHESFGSGMIIDILSGSKNKRILGLKANKLPQYGKSQKSKKELKAIITALINQGYLAQSEGEFPTLILTSASRDVTSGNTLVHARMQSAKEKTKPKITQSKGEEGGLLAVLKDLRSRIARSKRVPAYIIFGDKTLESMAEHMPKTREEFLEISGVGEVKAKNYAEIFTAEIKNYCENNHQETSSQEEEN